MAMTPTRAKAAPAIPSVQLKLLRRYKTSTVVKPLKVMKKPKKATERRRTSGLENTRANSVIGLSSRLRGSCLRASTGWVSGSKPSTTTRLVRAKAVAAQAGRMRLTSPSRPPRPGPRAKPSPNATPISPKALARFSGVVISARTAVAVAAVPPLAPSITRARNSMVSGTPAAAAPGQTCCQGRVRVVANSPIPSTDPITQQLITGLRPNRSLRAPISGATVNCDRA